MIAIIHTADTLLLSSSVKRHVKQEMITGFSYVLKLKCSSSGNVYVTEAVCDTAAGRGLQTSPAPNAYAVELVQQHSQVSGDMNQPKGVTEDVRSRLFIPAVQLKPLIPKIV